MADNVIGTGAFKDGPSWSPNLWKWLIVRSLSSLAFTLMVDLKRSLTFLGCRVSHRSLVKTLLHSYLYFLPIYLIGMASSRYRDIIYNELERYWYLLSAIFISLTIFIILAKWQLGNAHADSMLNLTHNRMDLMLLQKLLMSVLLLHFLRKYEPVLRRQWYTPMLDDLADISFGLFFVHPYVITIIKRLVEPLTYIGSISTFSAV